MGGKTDFEECGLVYGVQIVVMDPSEIRHGYIRAMDYQGLNSAAAGHNCGEHCLLAHL